MSGYHSFGNDASRRADKIGLTYYNAKPDPTNYKIIKSNRGSESQVVPFYPPPPNLDCTNLSVGEIAFSLGTAPQNSVEQEVRTSLCNVNANYANAGEEYKMQIIRARMVF